MNMMGIFFYIISVITWWAGFNYAATRTESSTRRKLLSTAAAFALAWPFAFIALMGALATKVAATLMITVGNGINSTWDTATGDINQDTHSGDTRINSDSRVDDAQCSERLSEPLLPPPPPAQGEDTQGHPHGAETSADYADTNDETVTIHKVSLADII